MVCCSAFGCSNRTDRKDKTENIKLTFHQFPKDSKIRLKWTDALRRKDWLPSERSVVCSIHFTQECFDRTSKNLTRLKRDVVPTIFPVSSIDLEMPLFGISSKRKRKLLQTNEDNPQSSTARSATESDEFVIREHRGKKLYMVFTRKKVSI